MALTDADRLTAAFEFIQRNFVGRNETANVNMDDIKAAAAACDLWMDSNQSSFNTALPQPFRGAASTEQKAALFMYVMLRRVGGA